MLIKLQLITFGYNMVITYCNSPVANFMSSISWELLVAYIIIKLSVYSVQDSTYKISIHCGEFCVTYDKTFLLSTGRREYQQLAKGAVCQYCLSK